MNDSVRDGILFRLKESGEDVALITPTHSLTCSQVLLSARKRFSDFGNHETVCIAADLTIETVILVISGILAGKTVVPMNPDQPIERTLKSMSQLSGSVWLDPRFSLPDLSPRASKVEKENAEILYILFTSGSTGSPKGVMIGESNLLNTLLWSVKEFDRNESTVVGLVAKPYFDIGFYEIVSAFYFGHRLAIISDPRDPFTSAEEIYQLDVSTIFSAPSFFSQLERAKLLPEIHAKSKLSSIISGGDFLPIEMAKSWLNQTECKLYNVWGPSETSVVNSSYLVSKNDIEFIEAGLSNVLPIGFSTDRMPVKVLNEQGSECKPLEKGELVVFGPAVGQGYLTAQPNDGFSEIYGQRAFKTGDIGYVDDKGRLNIVGRSANMIKISGFRIDPREVEFWLERICVGSNACILLQQNPGIPPYIVGVIGGGESAVLLASEIRNHLRIHIPEYMIPRKFRFFESLPLNANGKVDRESVRRLIANE